MRILLLGPIHREKLFLQQKGEYSFLRDQAHQSYVEALESLGHTVQVFRYTDTILLSNSLRAELIDLFNTYNPLLKARMQRLHDKFYQFSPENYFKNKKLIQLAQKFKPELIIFSGGTSALFPKTLEKIKLTFSCPIFLLWGINPEVSATLPEKLMVKKGIIDIVVENDCGYAEIWKRLGAKKVIVLPISAIDPKIHKKVTVSSAEKNLYDCDVCFIGTLTKERQKQLALLKGFNIKIWGDIMPEQKLDTTLAPLYHGPLHGTHMVTAYNCSKIAINFQPSDMRCGGNMRTFEIPGCGTFQLVDKVDNTWFTPGKNVAIFTNEKDLIKKITYYLRHADERKHIAEAGYKITHMNHTYKKHFETLLNNV